MQVTYYTLLQFLELGSLNLPYSDFFRLFMLGLLMLGE
jgi:hypothetical protein